MKDRKTSQCKLVTAVEKAGSSLKHVDIPGWETSKSAAEWVHASRRSKDRVFAIGRTIQQDSMDTDPDGALADVTEVVDTVRRKP
jgi:hypothetical protein